MSKKKRVTIYLLYLGFPFLLWQNTHAQNLIIANPGETGNPESNYVNPAVLPYQPAILNAGMKIFYVGFLEDDKFGFRNNFFSISTPYLLNRDLVLGLAGQHFSVPLYGKTQVNLQAGYRVKNKLSLGCKYNMISQSYNKEKFNVLDEFDPVFSNGTTKISHSIGLGIVYSILPNLDAGFSWNHININGHTNNPFS